MNPTLACLITLSAVCGALLAPKVLYLVRYIGICLRPSTLREYRRPNAWAVVTGSSDGIGRGLAFELASKGFNIILHGRNPQKLEEVGRAITAESPSVQVKMLIIDAAGSNDLAGDIERAWTKLEPELNGGPVTALFNCIGGMQMLPRPFMALTELSSEQTDGVINLNARFPTHLTRTLLPNLAANTPSLVVNVGGHGGILPMPYLNPYNSGKAFTLALSIGMSREMRELGVAVKFLNVHVGKVTGTGLWGEKGTFFEPDSRTFARAMLGKTGWSGTVVSSYGPHAMQLWFVRLFPEWVQGWMFASAIRDLKTRSEKQAAATTTDSGVASSNDAKDV